MLNKKNVNKMKNNPLIILGAALMLLSASSTMKANENVEVTALEDAKKIRVELNTPASSSVNVILYNRFDRVVYNDQISEGSTFESEIDFSYMNRGTYRLASKVGNLKYNRIIEVTREGIEFTDSYYTMLPEFRVQDDMLLVHMLITQDEAVGVSIEDSNGSVVNNYYYEPGVTFSIAYGLENLSQDTYTIRLLAGKDMFSYEFEVE